MGRVVQTTACPSCREVGGDHNGDNLAVYDDHTGYCFACGTFYPEEQVSKIVLDKPAKRWYNKTSVATQGNLYTSSSIINNTISNTIGENTINKNLEFIPHRSLTKDTLKVYNIQCTLSEKNIPELVIFPYGESSKIRNFDKKEFKYVKSSTNDLPLFGMDKFSAGSSKYITITEGEYDAASVFQMMGSKFPCVSVKSASQALTNCREAREYLNSFERIYLCFDNDGPGQEAAKNVSSLFDINKVYHVILTKYKDANDYLVKGEAEEFSRIWWNSKRITPKGIVSRYDDIFKLLKDKGKETIATYPFQTLSDMTYGIRLGEFILFKAPEKIGKTEVFRAIEHHLLKTTDYNIGIIHLEENERRTVDGLLSYETGVPCHVPDCSLSPEQKLEAYKKMTKTEDRLSYYAHFGSDDPDTILDVIRYLVAGCGCKFVFLDHITMLVTGFEGDDERKKLDYLSTRLAMLTRELNFTLFAISHVNDTGQTRGSRNIGKVADLIVSLDRDIKAADPKVRNTTKLLVEGNRFFAPSGPAGMLEFDVGSYTLKEVKIEKDMGAFNF